MTALWSIVTLSELIARCGGQGWAKTHAAYGTTSRASQFVLVAHPPLFPSLSNIHMVIPCPEVLKDATKKGLVG